MNSGRSFFSAEGGGSGGPGGSRQAQRGGGSRPQTGHGISSGIGVDYLFAFGRVRTTRGGRPQSGHLMCEASGLFVQAKQMNSESEEFQ